MTEDRDMQAPKGQSGKENPEKRKVPGRQLTEEQEWAQKEEIKRVKKS